MGGVNGWKQSVLLGGLLFLLVGCGASTVDPENLTASTPGSTPGVSDLDEVTAPPNEAAVEASTPAAVPNQATAESNTVPVVIYRVNSACTDFVAEPARVDADQALQAAVRQILSDQVQAELGLAGFRVSIDADTQIATVDFRLSPDSLRQFVSLSTCEQMALFGSLRQTLLQNSQWQVEAVEFTEQGEAIAL